MDNAQSDRLGGLITVNVYLRNALFNFCCKFSVSDGLGHCYGTLRICSVAA